MGGCQVRRDSDSSEDDSGSELNLDHITRHYVNASRVLRTNLEHKNARQPATECRFKQSPNRYGNWCFLSHPSELATWTGI